MMIQNYVKVAARNLYKRKFFTLVNAVGLSIGITMGVLIYLYLLDEQKFDAFHSKADQIVRLHERKLVLGADMHTKPASYFKTAAMSAAMVAPLEEEVPEVELVSHFTSLDMTFLSAGNSHFKQEGAFVSPSFLEMFDFGASLSNRGQVLADPSSIVLTRSAARKLFGDADPIGQTVVVDIWGNRVGQQVTAVIDDVPAWSSLPFDFLLPIELRPGFQNNRTAWNITGYGLFVQLKEGASHEAFQQSLDRLRDRYLSEHHQRWRDYWQVADSVQLARFEFLPLKQIHTAHDIAWHKMTNPQYALILSGIGLLIIVIACVNYVALALTSSIRRNKEIGVRKTMGASRGDVILQFCMESVMVALLTLVLVVVLTSVFITPFNQFVDKQIALGEQPLLALAAVMVALTVLVGLLAGSYPAYYMSRLNAIDAIKDAKRKFKAGFSRYLVVFQFGAASFLLMAAMVMYAQMNYVTSKDLGFDDEHVVVIPTQKQGSPSMELVERFRNAVRSNPDVISVGGVDNALTRGLSSSGFSVGEVQMSAVNIGVDAHYLPTLGIELVAGRNFREGSSADSDAVIVNEAFVRALGWEHVLDQTIPLGPTRKVTVVGIVKDHHVASLEEEIKPLFIYMGNGSLGHMYVRIRPGSLPGAIDELRQVWASLEPDVPFDYSFLDEDLASQYGTYLKWTRFMGLSTVFAVLIACLGLFGLAGINAVNRTKEVGIRKVMGASAKDIVLLLNRPFVIMAGIAFVLAIPAAQYVMGQWLANFEYAVSVDGWIYAIGFGASLLFVLATVSFHAFRAAGVNPVETLKYE